MRIFGDDIAAVEEFLREWESPEPYIEAHTSGSTGKPKTVHLPKSDMEVSARATNRRFGLDSASALLMPLSVDYIAGKMMVVRALLADCALYVERPSLTPMSAAVGLPQLQLVPVVPAQVPHLLADVSLALRVDNYIIGGAPLDPSVEKAMLTAGYRACATYGMTETCSHVALRPLGQPVYEAMPGVEFAIDADDCLRIVSPLYSWGELQTNDVVSLIDSTHFIWLGRRDFVINSGGVKIHPEEIESRLAAYLPGEFYITATPHDKWGSAVTLVCDRASGNLSDEEILNICRRELTRYQVPKIIKRVETIEHTATGKIKRK